MNASLLEAARRGDREAADQVLRENTGLIWSVVRRFKGRGVELEDLYQLGCMGFLKAVQGFDLDYGTQFSTYAVPKIAGEIRRFLRDDGPVKVGRSLREQGLAIYAARERLIGQLGREPALSELAAELDMAPEEIAAAELATAPAEGLTLEAALSDGSSEEELVEKLALRQAIALLPEREQQTIHLRFFRGLTQAKTAQILGVSQVQVSRLERRAVDRLRSYLEGWDRT